MAAMETSARNGPPTPADDLDDLFDYDVSDVFRDVDTNMDAPTRSKALSNGDGKENGAGLGIDEEIKVLKKRAPIPKLDESRLLSPAGIPKLRRVAKERLRFKGKGREYTDAARLLNVYQLWLDDLYPRAKFVDALSMIEKLGHTKRMQTMRKEWIRESKPLEPLDELENTTEKTNDRTKSSKAAQIQPPIVAPLESARIPIHTNALNNKDDFYEASASLAEKGDEAKRTDTSNDSLFVSEDEKVVSDQPPDDDLDALLAEDDTRRAEGSALSPRQAHINSRTEDNFDDDLEAMAGLDDMW
ncbi:replication fork protection complex subunit TIPIN/Csm3/Swi3, partial [Lecanoromycetidae sp. Uapishka_2]